MNAANSSTLWEILIPLKSNEGIDFSVEHHRKWEGHVKEISGGITLLGTAHGQWVSPQGRTFDEPVIPVRVRATREEMVRIGHYTATHYDQERVWLYRIADEIIEIKREDDHD